MVLSLLQDEENSFIGLAAPLYFMSMLAFCVVSLIPPPGPIRFFLFLPFVVALVAITPRVPCVIPSQKYSLGCNMVHCFLLYVDRLWLSHAERDFYRLPPTKRAGDPSPQPQQRVSDHWLAKLWWSCGLWIQLRGVGWSWQVKGVAAGAPPTYPRWKFVAKHVVWLLFLCLGPLEILQTAFQRSTPAIEARPGGLLEQAWWDQILMTWGFCIVLYLSLEATYSLGAIVAVMSGLAAPADWPPLYGPLSDACTLSGAWGSSWHQLMRRVASTYGHLVAGRLLRLRRGSLAFRIVVVYIGFFVSGSIHAFGAYCLAGHSMGQAAFFYLQPVGITCEELVIRAGRRLGYRDGPLVRSLGYIWVLAWLTWSARAMFDAASAQGIWGDDIVPPNGLGAWLLSH